eukprot:6871436-Ditylum_brightwellii.AAC.1
MKINTKCLEIMNYSVRNKSLPIPFYVLDTEPFGLPYLQAEDQPKGQEVSGVKLGGKVIKGQDIQDGDGAYSL